LHLDWRSYTPSQISWNSLNQFTRRIQNLSLHFRFHLAAAPGPNAGEGLRQSGATSGQGDCFSQTQLCRKWRKWSLLAQEVARCLGLIAVYNQALLTMWEANRLQIDAAQESSYVCGKYNNCQSQ